jgi:hypothetical protein
LSSLCAFFSFPLPLQHLKIGIAKLTATPNLVLVLVISMASTTSENRILELLLPYRDDVFEAPDHEKDANYVAFSAQRERSALSLAREHAQIVG